MVLLKNSIQESYFTELHWCVLHSFFYSSRSVSVFCRQFFFDQFHPSLFQKNLKFNSAYFKIIFIIYIAHTESYLSVLTALIFNFFYNLHCAYRVILVCINSANFLILLNLEHNEKKWRFFCQSTIKSKVYLRECTVPHFYMKLFNYI